MPGSNGTLRVAIVGCGFMGRMHANVYSALEHAELAVAIDHKEDRAKTFAGEFGVEHSTNFDEILARPEIDVIDVCLPTYLHREFSVKAMEAGKHVFCEKPMALTVADADAMIAASQKANVRLMIGHCIRFWPEYVYVKGLVESGQLGRLESINLTRYGAFPFWASDNWQADESKSGGGALDMHIHDTDFALHLLGKPKEMQSYGTHDGRGIGHIFTTVVSENGTIAQLEGGWNLPKGSPFKMAFRAIFKRGVAIMDGGPLTIYGLHEEPLVPEFPKMKAGGGGNINDLGGYYFELNHFVDRVLSGAPFDVSTPESSRESLEWTLKEISEVKRRLAAK